MYQLGNERIQELHCEMQKLRSIRLYRPLEESDSALHDMDRRLKASLLGNIDESRKPSQTEIEQYDESIIYRTQFLSRIKIAELIGDYRFEHVFKDLYNDVKRFEYAWFCIIFKREECLTYSQQAIRVLKSLAEMQFEKYDVQNGTNSLMMFTRALHCFKNTVGAEEAMDYFDYIDEFNSDHHQLLFTAARCHASLGNKDKAITFFEKALYIEESFEYLGKYRLCYDLVQGTFGCHVARNGFVLVCRDQIWKCLEEVVDFDNVKECSIIEKLERRKYTETRKFICGEFVSKSHSKSFFTRRARRK